MGLLGQMLHSGKFQTNHVSKAIRYFKHDEHAVIVHSGQAYWDDYIDTEPAFVKTSKPGKVFKESMSHPVLTYANVLKQANKYRPGRAGPGRTGPVGVGPSCPAAVPPPGTRPTPS